MPLASRDQVPLHQWQVDCKTKVSTLYHQRFRGLEPLFKPKSVQDRTPALPVPLASRDQCPLPQWQVDCKTKVSTLYHHRFRGLEPLFKPKSVQDRNQLYQCPWPLETRSLCPNGRLNARPKSVHSTTTNTECLASNHPPVTCR